jgi:hypothetical protein
VTSGGGHRKVEVLSTPISERLAEAFCPVEEGLSILDEVDPNSG